MTKAKVPDYEDMVRVADSIRDLSYKKMMLEAKIKFYEAEIVKEVTTNPKYQVGGKAPSMSLVEATVKFTGFEGEVVDYRKELARIVADLEHAKQMMEIYRMQVEILKTESFNANRAAIY